MNWGQRGTASVIAYRSRWSRQAFRTFAAAGLLGVLAASSAQATTTIPGGNLNGTLTQAGSPYVVTGSVTVTTSLTVEAGVVVRFRNALLMQVTGTLATQGTAGQPVTFTSDPDTVGGQPAAGNWYGIRTSGGATLALANTFIRYGGAGNGANLWSSSGTISSLNWNGGGSSHSAYDGIGVTSSATTLTGLTVQNNVRNGITLTPPANAAITLTGLTVQTNAGNGINLTPAGPLSVSVLDQLVVSNNVGRAIAVTQNATSIPWGTLSGSGNGTNGIYVTGIMWGSNRKWEWGAASPNFPYVLDNVQVSYGDTLAIAAGAVVKFLSSSRLYLNVSGSGSALQTLGTTNNPVWFTSIKDDTQGGDTNGDGGASVPAPGNYYGVTCYGTSVLSLAQTWMAYGGASNSANLYSVSGAISSLNWNGGGCSYSAYDGIGVTSSATTLTGLTVQNNVRNGITLTPPANAAITLTGLTVQANAGNGINLTPSGPLSVSVLDQLVVSNNVGRAIAITQNATSIPWGTLSGSGNGTNGIYVTGIMSGSNRKWEWGAASPNFPYVLDNVQVSYGDTLAIAAGAVVKFLPSSRLYLNVSGSGSALQTLGTTNNPVWFTSIKDDTQGGDTNGDGGASVPAPGNWYGVTCYGTSVLSLAQTWMAYGGASNTANLHSYTGTISSITWNGGGCLRSAYRGIWVNTSSLSMNGVRFASNVNDGAYITPGSNGSATGCDFYGNGGTYGLYNSSTTYTIDASNSWWGDPSGPNDPSQGPPDFNPSGLGSRVSDYVTYRPWATTMQTNEQPTGFALIAPTPGEKEFRDTLHFRWSHSTAPDGGPISYALQVDDDPAFGSPEINQTGLPDTTFDASDLLESEYVYYWKVLAIDARGGQRQSAPAVSWFQTYPGTSGVPGSDLLTHSAVFRVGDPTPNPFHGPNSLAFSLPASARVRLDVFDIAGRLVRTLLDGPIGSGEHIVAWDGQDRAGRLVESGVYLYRFRSDRGNAVRRAVILR